MAFSQWTVSKSHATEVVADLSTSTVLEGSSSLRFGTPSASLNRGVIGLTSGANITTGKIRTLVRYNAVSAGFAVGIFGMMQTAIAHGNNAYWAAMLSNDTLIRLKKGNVDNLDETGVDLATAAHGLGTLAINTVYALQLQWQRDTDSGFVVLNVATDGPVASPSTYDYSTLTTRITYTDSSSPYSTGVSAGLGFQVASSGGDRQSFWDTTQIFRV